MNTNNWIFLAFALFALAFTSCTDPEPSDSVDQDRIYTNYELEYNANDDVTTVKVTFHFGEGLTGTMLSLEGGSEVNFNGTDLLKDSEPITNRTIYTAEFSGFVDEGTFKWTDTEGNIYTNMVSTKGIDYPADLTALNRSETYEFFWQGEVLEENETVTLTINGEQEFDLQVFFQTTAGSDKLMLFKSQLENLDAGEGRLKMERKNEIDATDVTSAGGRMLTKYIPKHKTIDLN